MPDCEMKTLGLGTIALFLLAVAPASIDTEAAERQPVTFNREIAPLLFEHCSGCHRPGQSGPFSLLNYGDARKRAKQLAEVTARRYMPPWLPEGDPDEFVGDRRLTDPQIRLFQSWLADGTPEGLAADLPPTPQWPQGWQLGPPDLILKMPRKHAGGKGSGCVSELRDFHSADGTAAHPSR